VITECCKPLASPPIPAKIPDRYKPLHLPPFLHDLPINYINNLPRFDGENVKITAEKHIQNLEDFLDLFEVEDDDVCIRIFPYHCKVKSRIGLRIFQMQALAISISL
jgi:hypothetical protein